MRTNLIAAGAAALLLTGLAALTTTEKANAAPAASAVPLVEASSYAIDAVHSHVYFQVRHNDVGLSIGRFNGISGEYTVDAENPQKSKVVVEIAAESVDTQNAKRDQHLRGPDFFDAKQFPTIRFESSKVEAIDKQAGKYKVTGELSLHGKKKEITAELERVGEKDLGREYRSGYYGTFELKRSDFGMTNLLGGVGDDIKIVFSFEGVRRG